MNSTAQQPNMLIPLIMFVAVFYFFLIRPQKKREKEKQAMITDSVIAKIANDVKIEISKEAVTLVQEQKIK